MMYNAVDNGILTTSPYLTNYLYFAFLFLEYVAKTESRVLEPSIFQPLDNSNQKSFPFFKSNTVILPSKLSDFSKLIFLSSGG